jgi:hypothetical protein
MKRILAAIALFVTLSLTALPAYASCTYHTYTVNGRMVTCSTCCYGNQCYTNCY